MNVEISFQNGLILCVKVEFHINSIFLEKIVMDFMGKTSHLEEALSKFYMRDVATFTRKAPSSSRGEE
jgi:hypothetical protein